MADTVLPVRAAETHKDAADIHSLLNRIRRALQNIGNTELVGDILAEAGDQSVLLMLCPLKDGIKGRVDDYVQHGDHYHQHRDDNGLRMGVFHTDAVHKKALEGQSEV